MSTKTPTRERISAKNRRTEIVQLRLTADEAKYLKKQWPDLKLTTICTDMIVEEIPVKHRRTQ